MDGADLAKVAAALRAQSPELRKAMGKHLRARAVPVREAMRAAVLGMDSKEAATGRGGAASRAAYAYSKTKAGRADTGGYRTPLQQAKRDKAMARLTKRAGLRASIARGIRIEYRDTRAATAGVTIRTNAAALPEDQRSLPMLMDKGTWRHPVFARRDSDRYVTPGLWVAQEATPAGWWTNTGKRWAPTIRRDVADAFGQWAIRAAVDINRAAEG